jgi:hypothetical protein
MVLNLTPHPNRARELITIKIMIMRKRVTLTLRLYIHLLLPMALESQFFYPTRSLKNRSKTASSTFSAFPSHPEFL